ncbi:hypothetical protein SAMN05192529_13115 [Arachidicoccus rhizosphaerae]|uniref:Uncharacterized protein n=1 Tax=Arachidicoccus rhizosphaerae TaxID=551991 RepID=A0A1H4CES4_9BACT|nr:hypothetical protein [Arachidicoccus rhizosphaerae]SEA58935.1 hypothetical protein SAMN05192529_13115 [Arachidicoccus rhizosphaerae]
MNILILTIIALVLIAAGYVLCRPKDHGVDNTFIDYHQPDYRRLYNLYCADAEARAAIEKINNR